MKKLYYYFIATFATGVLLFSCHKEDPNPYQGKIHVEGQVLEKGKIANLIPNAQVVLYEVKSNGGFSSVFFSPIDTVLTDKNGNYVIDRSAAGLSGSYHIAANADPTQFYNRTDEPVQGEGIRANAKIINTLFIQPLGFLKINIRNIMPVNKDDAISIGGAWSGASETYIGNTNLQLVRRVFGNDTTRIGFGIQKANQEPKYGEERKFLKSHDTLNININY